MWTMAGETWGYGNTEKEQGGRRSNVMVIAQHTSYKASLSRSTYVRTYLWSRIHRFWFDGLMPMARPDPRAGTYKYL